LVVKPTKVSKLALLAVTTCSGVSVMGYLQKLKKEMVLIGLLHWSDSNQLYSILGKMLIE
jgi:hypothetical protein